MAQLSATPIKPRRAYGGVLFDKKGRVLLVEPNVVESMTSPPTRYPEMFQEL